MKKKLLIILILTLTLFAAAFGLEGVAHQNAQKEHIWLMETLLPGGKDFVRVPFTDENGVISSVHQADNGFVIETVTRGYADEITVVIGVDNQGTVTGLVTLNAHETFGLGSHILTDHSFLSQFLNKSGSFSVGIPSADAFSGATGEVTASGTEMIVDGISGATVSSKAVARCVNAAVAWVTGADVDSSATQWGG